MEEKKIRFAIIRKHNKPTVAHITCKVCEKIIEHNIKYVIDLSYHYNVFHLKCLPENYKIIEVKKKI